MPKRGKVVVGHVANKLLDSPACSGFATHPHAGVREADESEVSVCAPSLVVPKGAAKKIVNNGDRVAPSATDRELSPNRK